MLSKLLQIGYLHRLCSAKVEIIVSKAGHVEAGRDQESVGDLGQTQVCHLWNMLASETREGDVFHRLFQKLEIEREALGGRVFDILGEVFEEKSLKDLLAASDALTQLFLACVLCGLSRFRSPWSKSFTMDSHALKEQIRSSSRA